MELAVFQVLALLLVAAVVGMGARTLRLPYTLALVVAGIALGVVHVPELHNLHLTPHLLLAIFLPALLFEAAYHVEFSKFRRNAGIIMLLAIPGVLLSVVIAALLSWPLLRVTGLPVPLGACFLLATMIAATDPISVLALFRSLGVNRRLYLLVEGESLLNDGIAVVAFIIVAAVLGVDTGHGDGHAIHGLMEGIWFGLRTFVWMGGAGLAIGAAMGLVVSVSLFLQGLTMGPLLGALGLLGMATKQDAYEVARAKAMMATRALAEVESRADSGILTPATADRLAALYRHRKETEKARAEALAGEDLAVERLQDAALHLLMVEEETLRHAVDEGTIDRDAAHALFADIAVRREALRHGEEGPEALRHAVETMVPDVRTRAATEPVASMDSAPESAPVVAQPSSSDDGAMERVGAGD